MSSENIIIALDLLKGICIGFAVVGLFVVCLFVFGCASNINVESMEECERYTLHGEFEACQ